MGLAGPLRVAALVEWAWDPLSVELDPDTGAVDRRRTVSVPGPGSLDAVELGLRLGSPAAVLDAQAATIPVLRARGPAAPQATFLGHRPPRPAAPRAWRLDRTLSAEARIAEVVGLAAPERHRELVTGSAEELAARIVTFLEERGFL